MNNLTVNYYLPGEKISKIEVPRNVKVGEFLNLLGASKKKKLYAIFVDGRKLDPNDLIRNNLKSPSDVIIVSDNEKLTADDFFSISPKEEASAKASAISESMRVKPVKSSASKSAMINKKYRIFTTVSERSFTQGDEMQIHTTKDSLKTITTKIKQMIRGWGYSDLPDDFEVHIFLPGGIPFLDGFISDYISSGIDTTKDILTVVVTKKLKPGLLEKTIDEPCNCTGDMKDLLSPLYESSQAGLTQVAALLGYFYHGGVAAEKIFMILAKITRFAPLIVNLYRLLEHSQLVGLNIIAVAASLYTFIKSNLTEDVSNENVFEYTLKTISYISLLSDMEFLKLLSFDVNPDADEDDPFDYYCTNYGHHQIHQVVWEEETNPNRTGFEGYDLDPPDPDILQTILEMVATFKPVSPLSLHFIFNPTFIKAERADFVMLYLNDVPGKKDTINYIDPLKGRKEEITIDNLSRLVHDTTTDDVLALIDHQIVQQLIVICFDKSVSMKFKLIGGNPRGAELSRFKLATSFLQQFVEQSNKLRVSSIYGLISFGSEVTLLQDMTPISSDFLSKLETIKPAGKTLLWEAVKQASDILSEMTAVDEDELPKYTNAQKRIIVITDGEDNKSNVNLVGLTNDLIKNDVIVDTVLVSLRDENNECCAVSKLTGGLCFRPGSLEEGLSIFEQEAFLNIKKRHLHEQHAPNVTEDTISNLADNITEYDTKPENQEMINARHPVSLATPFNIIYDCSKSPDESLRKNRALHELNIIGHRRTPNCIVLSYHSGPDNWRIFLKGPKGTSFDGKYLNIHMNLPPAYPSEPPIFRFLTKVFHPNVSDEGKLVFSLVDKKYESDLSIIDIIDGIYNILAKPELETAVNREALALYRDNRDEYLARQAREDESVPDFKTFLKGVKVYKKVPKGKTPNDSDIYSQITMTQLHPHIPDDPESPDDLLVSNFVHGVRHKVVSDDPDEEEENTDEPALTVSYIRPKPSKIVPTDDDENDDDVNVDTDHDDNADDLMVSVYHRSKKPKVVSDYSEDEIVPEADHDELLVSTPFRRTAKMLSDDDDEPKFKVSED